MRGRFGHARALAGAFAAQRKLGSFLEAGPVTAAQSDHTGVHVSQVQHPGEFIGRYKLLEEIGEGGMGVGLGGRTDRTGQTQGGREDSSRPGWIRRASWPASKPNGKRWP